MAKFKARYVVIPLLAVVVAGGVFGAVKAKQAQNVVKVFAASEESDMNSYAFSDMANASLSLSGRLEKGSVSNVKVDTDMTIEEVKVKKGQSVKKGDVLIAYDTHSLEDAVADAELQVQTLTNEITITQNELDILARLQPSENAPKEEEPQEPEIETPDVPSDSDSKLTFEKKITKKSKPLAGEGTKDDPFVFTVGEDTVIANDYLKSLAGKFAAFYVCDETGNQLYTRVIDGSLIESAVKDFKVNDGVTVTEDGMISYDGGSVKFAAFVTSAGVPQMTDFDDVNMDDIEIPDEMPEPEPNTDMNTSSELSLNDNYIYSAEEIKTMIKDKTKEKAALELQKKQAELDVKTAKHKAETGGETAAIDGVITFLAQDIKHLSTDGAYIIITNDNGMSVESSIGEFSRDKIKVGDTVNVTNYENDSKVSGIITFISDEPEADEESERYGGMESRYRFTLVLNEEMEIGEDSEVMVSVVEDSPKDALYIEDMLIRSEGSRYYVLAVNSDEVLEKRYIEVGRRNYNVAEVTSGLTSDDRIAFPYGKAKPGAATKTTSLDQALYGGLLF